MIRKLPGKDKILFAVGGLGENVTFQAVTAWLIFFWAGKGDPEKALVPIGLLGVLLGVGRFIEAFDDPLIGYLSDRTKSRWGRRFPYVFFGAPFLALTFFLLWIPLAGVSISAQAVYLFIILQLFFLAYTLVSAPYEGILPEIAKTSADRVSTSAWRVLFGVIGAAIGLVVSGIIIQFFGFVAMGGILGIVSIIAFWIAVFGIRKRLSQSQAVAKINLFVALRSTLRNSQFLIFSLAFILFSLGLNLLTALMPFYVKVILGRPEGMVALFSGLVLVSMLTSLPLYNLLSKLKGKKWVYSRSMFILAGLFPLLFVVGMLPIGDAFIQLVVLAILIGVALAGQFVFPNAILADVIDYDATKTGLRREAIYYGMQNTLQKFSFALSSIIFGTTLSFFGATVDHSLGLRLIGPIAGLATLFGFVIFVLWYKLPDEV
ncbi:MAG: MFS transporter [Candidatus Blackburnbacteria bacterium]|nr:MFS transporter [Candidatus Blackburnbacteria bacterium]